jgi:hypothetical protein
MISFNSEFVSGLVERRPIIVGERGGEVIAPRHISDAIKNGQMTTVGAGKPVEFTTTIHVHGGLTEPLVWRKRE